MTAAEVYELTTVGGMTVFKQVLVACEELGPYCLIGGLAVNCYVEPLYTLDADFVFISSPLSDLGRPSYWPKLAPVPFPVASKTTCSGYKATRRP